MEKDVDALNPMTLKKIDEGEESYFPAGVGAVLEIFERYKIKVEGKNITVIGISDFRIQYFVKHNWNYSFGDFSKPAVKSN